jgi:hypothetical protein
MAQASLSCPFGAIHLLPSSARFRFSYRVDLGIEPYVAGGFGLSGRRAGTESPSRVSLCSPRQPPLGKGAFKMRSPGRIQRGAEAPLCVVLIRVVLRRARRVKQTCRGHVCSQSGEQTCLRPGQEKSKSSPLKCRFSCNFSLDKQREVEFPTRISESVWIQTYAQRTKGSQIIQTWCLRSFDSAQDDKAVVCIQSAGGSNEPPASFFAFMPLQIARRRRSRRPAPRP